MLSKVVLVLGGQHQSRFGFKPGMSERLGGAKTPRGFIHDETMDKVEWGREWVGGGRVSGRVGVHGRGRGGRGRQVREVRCQVGCVNVDKGEFARVGKGLEGLYATEFACMNERSDAGRGTYRPGIRVGGTPYLEDTPRKPDFAPCGVKKTRARPTTGGYTWPCMCPARYDEWRWGRGGCAWCTARSGPGVGVGRVEGEAKALVVRVGVGL